MKSVDPKWDIRPCVLAERRGETMEAAGIYKQGIQWYNRNAKDGFIVASAGKKAEKDENRDRARFF